MYSITRWGQSPRFADVVIYRGEARWVEVAEDPTQDTAGQVRQVLAQIDDTLARLGSQPTDLLQILVYLADLKDAPALNAEWDRWVRSGQAPIRACVQAGLSGNYRVEMVITAAASEVPG